MGPFLICYVDLYANGLAAEIANCMGQRPY